MKYSLAVPFAACLAVFLQAAPAYSEPATREKCTCDLSDPSEHNGAWVRNATACWSSENPNRQWCRIDVAEIEGNGEARETVNFLLEASASDDIDAIVEKVSELFISYAELQLELTSDDGAIYKVAMTDMPGLIDEFRKEIGLCMSSFLQWHQNRTTGVSADTGRFQCSVGEQSGWLNMRFRFDGFDIRYMVAPNG